MKEVLSIQNTFGEQVILPDGYYLAKWSSFQINFHAKGREYILTTNVGIKSITPVDVVVIVENGIVTYNQFSN